MLLCSFGIILWEIVTRDVPYKHHNDYNTFSRAGMRSRIVDSGVCSRK